jgi:hypothetical protein
VATDGGGGAAEVAGFPGSFQGAEGGRNVLGELGTGGGVNGLGGREAFDGPEGVEGLDKFPGVGKDGDEVVRNWYRELGGFSSWPSKRAG